jgi:hypothetical protein
MILLILMHLALVVFSWRVATRCQNNNNQFGYYLNMFASALNGAVLMRYIF